MYYPAFPADSSWLIQPLAQDCVRRSPKKPSPRPSDPPEALTLAQTLTLTLLLSPRQPQLTLPLRSCVGGAKPVEPGARGGLILTLTLPLVPQQWLLLYT